MAEQRFSKEEWDRIRLANQRVPITTVCTMIGMDVPPIARMKVHCPFEHLYHSDGGIDAAFQIYEDGDSKNSAWCWACGRYFSPVLLFAQAQDLSEPVAAQVLLDRTGYVPPTLESLLQAAERAAVPVDTAYLARALKTYCSRICDDWEDRQLDPEVADRLSRCLALLTRVRSDDDAERWLDATKRAMADELS